jgi:serine/threonine protein kinase, bacterial
MFMVRASTLRIDKEICPGYRLGRFRGKGGFGSVWEATNPKEKLVALKFLPCNDDMSAAQEIRSIQMVRKLRHPNLVRIEQVWCHRGYVVVTMELADGSLLDLLEGYQAEFGTPLVRHDVCRYLSQVAATLDFLNSRQHVIDGQYVGLQHCDIKPTNLLLFGEKVKLSDFGLTSQTSCALKAHQRAGTKDYTAPEVLQGRLSDWTDQYSLAITYCHLRGGSLPFEPTLQQLSNGSVPREPDLSLLTPAERPIIERALASVPQNRWPTCRELMARLTSTLS